MHYHHSIPQKTHGKIIAWGSIALLLCSLSGCRSSEKFAPWSAKPAGQSTAMTGSSDFGPSGSIGHTSEFHAPEIPEIPPSTEPLTEEEVVAIFREAGGKLRPDNMGQIVEIDLSFSDISDAQLQSIDVFPDVAELDLTGTEIGDDAVPALARLPGLRAAKLKGTKITDEGLRLLSNTSTLILLDASNTAVSDEGLRDAGGWSSLRYLSLNNTAISDEGLQYLESLHSLKGLSVIGTEVTEEGVRSLKNKLPNCLIVAQSVREVRRTSIRESMPQLSEHSSLAASSTGVASHDQLSQVIQLAGQQPHLAVHLSKIYTQREQWREATQILSVAAAANPSDPAIHYALGQSLARSGRTDEAMEHFEQSVDEATARYQVAMIVYENSLKKCERLFDDAVSADPSLSVAEIRRAEIQQELAQLQRRRSATTTNEPNHFNQNSLEVVPGPPVRNASHSRLRLAR